MDIILLLTRLLLAVIFIFSGLAKLVDRSGSRQTMRDFGVSDRLATPFAILLPLAELVVAGSLIPGVSAWWGAFGALVLLLLFTAVLGYHLTRGHTPSCHCFGQVSSKPIGWPTLVRNLILVALAGIIVGFGRLNSGAGVLDWLIPLSVAQRVEVLAGAFVVLLLVLETWIVLRVLHQHGELLLRLNDLETRLTQSGTPGVAEAPQPVTNGLPIGSLAPAFSLPGLYGETITLDFLRASNQPVLLIFSDPSCGPCNELLPEVGRWQRDYAGKLTLALVSRGSLEANRLKLSEHKITHALLQQDREIARDYRTSGTPCAILVRPDGTIASQAACGAEAIRALTAQAVGLPALKSFPGPTANGNKLLPVAALSGSEAAIAPSQLARPQVGDPVPAFTLSDLDGKTFSLSNFRGNNTLLLFWNPSCGFCQQMLADLKTWEAEPPDGAPQLLVVSTGSIEANRMPGLRSPVLLDEEFTVGPRFGIHGTPMAVLVDAEGKIASEVAAGAVEVFALAASG